MAIAGRGPPSRSYAPGVLIFTDNIGFPSTRPFRDHVRNQPDRRFSLRLPMGKGGTERSCFVGNAEK